MLPILEVQLHILKTYLFMQKCWGYPLQRDSAYKPSICLWISEYVFWTANTIMEKKAQQRLHFQRVLNKDNQEIKLLVSFYRATIESILGYCITV